MALTTVRPQGIGFNTGRRNLIINGAMQVAQRGTVTGVTSGYGGPDRYQFSASGGAEVTLSQDTDVPSNQGFSSSFKLDVTTEDNSLAADDYALLRQRIEAQNLQHLLYGTSGAKKVTLQFWVKSPKTGVHILEFLHADANYYNSQSYTITAANTWQKVTLTFDGYQTTAINNDNGVGLVIDWWLAAGSTYSGGTLSSNTWHNTQANRAVGQVNVVDNTSNNFYITGVQLEVGENASDFEHRSFGEELQSCSRYYQQITYPGGSAVAIGFQSGTTDAQAVVTYPYGLMRAAPDITLPTAGQGSSLLTFLKADTNYPTTTGNHTAAKATTDRFFFTATGYTGLNGGGLGSWLYTGLTGGSVTFKYNAEL